MRAVSLSDDRVISLLNSSFVPVYTSNEDYVESGSAPPEERKLLEAIRRDGLAKGLSVGSVHAYLLTANGRVLDSLHTVDAAKPAALLRMLSRAVEAHGIAAGKPAVAPAERTIHGNPNSALALQLTARYLELRDGKLAPVEGAGGNWSALPGEDTISFTAGEASGFAPRASAVGTVWNLDSALVRKIALHCYPPTENNDLLKNEIQEASIACRLESTNGGKARVTFRGGLRMKHPFYHRPDDWAVTADLHGYYDIDLRSAAIEHFRMASDGAEYRNGAGQRLPFGIALRSIPHQSSRH